MTMFESVDDIVNRSMYTGRLKLAGIVPDVTSALVYYLPPL